MSKRVRQAYQPAGDAARLRTYPQDLIALAMQIHRSASTKLIVLPGLGVLSTIFADEKNAISTLGKYLRR